MHESWQANYNEIKEEIERFELMESGEQTFYFDVHTVETIFDFFSEKFQFEKAERILQIGILQHPNATSLQSKQAIIHMEKGDDDTAISLMERLLKLEHSNPEIYLNLGLAYLRKSRIEEAVICFKHSLEVAFDEKEDILTDIGAYLNQEGEYKHTIGFLKDACNNYPGNENMLFELAFAYDKEFDLEKGLVAYNKLLDINPFSENAWYNLGILYIKNNDHDNAMACYDYALAINPSHGESLFNKANTLVNKGLLIEAIDFYIEYISFNNDVLLPYHYIADCYDQLGMPKQSLRFYQLTVKEDPAYMPAWLGYLAVLINEEKTEEALEVSQKALELHEDITEIWYLRARSLLLANDFTNAMKAFETCFQDDPDNLRYLYELFQLKQTLRPKLKPAKMLSDWQKMYPESPAVQYLTAAYYLIDNRNLVVAGKHLESALNEDPENFEFFLELFPSIEKMIAKSKKLNHIVEKFFPYEL
jgi:tetratricopeptide (TPR) repeat protein